jgi:type II secretory pathway pseudopilin PulG
MKENSKNKIFKVRGFTLVEILFSVSIFIVVFLTLTLFSRNIWVYSTFISGGLENIDNSRNALKTMITEIRTAEQAETGAYMINQASGSTFSFYSDINNDGIKEKIRYFLDSGSIKKGVTEPKGSPLSYGAVDEKISTIATYITNTSVFDYYDENYDGNSDALPFPIDITKVRLVKITLTMDKDINRSPSPMTLTSQVSIRNLKENL